MTGDKVTEQLRHVAAAYKQGFADGYQVAKKELITCKNCKYYTGKWCTKFSTKQFDLNDICTADDDYCSMAERKEE